ncbi:hypothetical protein ACFPIJ_62520 [Dactylosporangium cerinum]|uniref:Uncharacterized protein n=1 Tax=Dactylosporangium cerinum TaxID=1434730 RepID=A0ABV9WJU3_9ACTN
MGGQQPLGGGHRVAAQQVQDREVPLSMSRTHDCWSRPMVSSPNGVPVNRNE